MNEKTYIVEIPQVDGDETAIYLDTTGYPVKSLFAIVNFRWWRVHRRQLLSHD